MIASCALLPTNEYSFQLSPPFLVLFLQIFVPLPNLNRIYTYVGHVKRVPQMKKIYIISWVPQSSKFTCRIFQSFDGDRIQCYSILGDIKGSISYLLQLGPITVVSAIFTSNLVAQKRENPEPILTLKRTKWRKFVDYFDRSIEADPCIVGKKNVYIFHIGKYHILCL